MSAVPITREIFSSVLSNPEQLDLFTSPIDDDIGTVMNWLSPDFTQPMMEPSPRVKTAIKNVSDSRDLILKLYLDSIRSFFVANALPYVQLSETNNITNVLSSIDKVRKYYEFHARYFESSLNQLSLSIFFRSLNSLLQLSIESPAHTSELKNLITRHLFDINKSHDFNSLISYTKILKSIGLNNDLNSIILELTVDHIRSYINETCSEIWDEPFITRINQWIELELYPSISILMFENIPSDKKFIEDLKSLAYDELVSLRTKESFDIVVDFPDSSTALLELRACIKTKSQRATLVNQFIQLANKRLLHSGANTVDVITCYTSAIKSFLIIDPKGVLLDKICRPIRRYLKERDDIIPKIVSGLMDATPDNELIELAQELRKPVRINTTEIDDLKDLNWTPDPIDALPDFKKGKVSDVIESLISIFDSKDIFISEFIQVFSQQLLSLTDYDITGVLFKLELLKLRFGDAEFGSLDVMVKDVKESKRINNSIQLASKEESKTKFHSTILSYLYWPSLPKDNFKVPAIIQTEFEKYSDAFETLKQGRKLRLLPFLGTVKIDLELKDRTLTFDVSTDKASVIHLFQDNPKLSFDEICASLELPSYLASKSISFWVKEGVLVEEPPKVYSVLEKSSVGNTNTIDTDVKDSISSSIEVSGSLSAASKEEKSLNRFLPYIDSMLMNLGPLNASSIYTYLSAVVPEEVGFDITQKQLESFLKRCNDEEKLDLNDELFSMRS